MNTNNTDNNDSGKKTLTAKSLLRKINADLGETKSQLNELTAKTEKSSKNIPETYPDKSEHGNITKDKQSIDKNQTGKPQNGANNSIREIIVEKQHKSETVPVVKNQTPADKTSKTSGVKQKPGEKESSPSSVSPTPGRIVYHFIRSGKKKTEKTPKYQGTYVKTGDKNSDTATRQITKLDILQSNNKTDINLLMKKYLSEEEYGDYIKRHADAPDEKHFEAARNDPATEQNKKPGELNEHDSTAIKAETAELSQEDIDIKKRIRDAEDYVRSITDQPPVVGREKGKAGDGDFDETDVNLMIAFGMDDELANTVGIDRVNQIEANIARDSVQYKEAAETGDKKIKKSFEYSTPEQTKNIFRNYKNAYRNLLLKLLICIAAFIAAFLYENIGLFGGQLPSPLNSAVYPITNIMFDLQLVAICGMLVWRELANGIISLVQLKPTPSSMLASVLALTLIYDIVMCFAGVQANGIVLYGFPAILCVFLSLIGEVYNLRREVYSFKIAASKRVKYAVDRLAPEDAELETGAFGEYMPEQPSIFRVSRTSFIDGFYRRSAGYSRNKAVIGAVIPLIVIIAAIFFVVAYYKTHDAVGSFETSYLALMMCMPASVFVLYSYPMFKASAAAYELESAIIGDASVDEYTSASAISFDDKDVFPSTGVKVRSVKVYGHNRIDQVIYNAASIFNIAGGSLSDVFDIATIDLGHSDDVEILDVTTDGLEATVSGVHIYLGRASYLRRNSFVPVRDVDDEDLENGGEICIMYMVCGDEVAAKMYVQYHIDPDFEFILKQLYSAGVCVGIKTSDPNIDDRMMGMRVKLEKYPVKVLKCKNTGDQNVTKPRVDSGIVSKSSVKSLLQTLALCDKVQHITKTNIVIKLFAILIGVLLSGFLLALGLSSGVMSFYVALYQLFWILPMIIITKMFVN